MLKIRLMRIGAKKRPFYRIVVVDERAKRNGAYVELVGTYNPLTHPHEIILKQDRIDHWLKMGAVKSDGFLRIIGEAPKRPERKAKKAPKEEKTEGTSVKPTEEDSIATPSAPLQNDNIEPVIASEAKQSSSEEKPTQIAAEPLENPLDSLPPHNDEIEVTEETKEEIKEEAKEEPKE